MYSKCVVTQFRNRISVFLLIALLIAIFAPGVEAQTPAPDAKPADAKTDQQVYQTLYLTCATDQNSLNDIQTDLRNILPRARIYGIPSQNAISVRATPEDIATAQKIIADVDRPRKVYRLTYTISETGGSEAAARVILR